MNEKIFNDQTDQKDDQETTDLDEQEDLIYDAQNGGIQQ
jgi:hypothetical protein